MNKYHLLSLVFFISGIVFFAIGVLSGEVETGFVVVFPFLVGSGLNAFLGFILVFVAILLFMFGFVSSATTSGSLHVDNEDEDVYPRKKKSVKGGGVVIIGPIPIIFGSSWKIAVIMMIVAIILIITIVLALRPL